MLIRNAREHTVPVRAPKVRRGAKVRNRVLLRANVRDNDIVHIVLLELRSQINVDLNPVLRVLLLNRVQQAVEPLGGAKVADDPGEVDLAEARRLARVEVVHAVPDALQDTRERRDADAGADEQHRVVVQKVLRGRAERAVDHHAREHAVHGRGHDLAALVVTALAALVALGVEVAADGLGERAGEIADDADVHGDVVFLRRGGEREGVPLEVGHLGAGEEDVLAGARRRLFLLDLELHDLGRMLDDFGDVRAVPRANLTEDALPDPDDTADKPVALRNGQ